jgi:hypothetical protein
VIATNIHNAGSAEHMPLNVGRRYEGANENYILAPLECSNALFQTPNLDYYSSKHSTSVSNPDTPAVPNTAVKLHYQADLTTRHPSYQTCAGQTELHTNSADAPVSRGSFVAISLCQGWPSAQRGVESRYAGKYISRTPVEGMVGRGRVSEVQRSGIPEADVEVHNRNDWSYAIWVGG